GAWDEGKEGADWSYEWNTTGLNDGRHDLDVRVNYSGAYDHTDLYLNTDNTPPEVTDMDHGLVTTGDMGTINITATDP
ncbi:MAG: hypothetical protein GWN18_00680, partial [Thermoplasmata archaeon]|nr:hypothetical protein [Thermoplasmata archaeon]NIS10509.1 hypothetical protein [Thermoplasmata archaeon]NIS18471.1 hypothetical protein [Thermoplasmata archaeon]NIT75457.1 hypothetical protein [Thermoplasmata archaeon]NIU47627.1 hypothetical protein [Thermoplasmata archaeon]